MSVWYKSQCGLRMQWSVGWAVVVSKNDSEWKFFSIIHQFWGIHFKPEAKDQLCWEGLSKIKEKLGTKQIRNMHIILSAAKPHRDSPPTHEALKAASFNTDTGQSSCHCKYLDRKPTGNRVAFILKFLDWILLLLCRVSTEHHRPKSKRGEQICSLWQCPVQPCLIIYTNPAKWHYSYQYVLFRTSIDI